MALHYNVRQLSSRVEALSCIIVHWDGLDEGAQISEFNAGIVCSATASCVEEEDGLSCGFDLGIDEGVFVPDIFLLYDEERAGGQTARCEGGEMCFSGRVRSGRCLVCAFYIEVSTHDAMERACMNQRGRQWCDGHRLYMHGCKARWNP